MARARPDEDQLRRGGRVNAVNADSVQSSQLNQFYSARVQTGPAKLRFNGLYSFRNHFAPPTDFVGFELGLKSRRKESTYDVDAVYAPGGRLSFTGRAVRQALRYDADAVYQGSSLHDNLNRNSDAVGGGFALALTPLTSFAAGAELTRDSFLYATNRDGSGYRAFAGAQFKPLAVLSGRAMVGYISFNPKVIGASYGGPYYRVGITTAHGPWVLNVDGTRTVDFSFDPSKGYFITNGVDVYTTVAAMRNVEVFLRGSLRNMDPKGLLAFAEPQRGITYFKTGAAYRLGRLARLGVDVEKYDYASDVPGGFKGVRVTTFLIYGVEKMQRLDRPLPGSF